MMNRDRKELQPRPADTSSCDSCNDASLRYIYALPSCLELGFADKAALPYNMYAILLLDFASALMLNSNAIVQHRTCSAAEIV